MFQPIRGHVSNLGFKIGVTINILESQLTYLNHPQGNISAKSGEVNWYVIGLRNKPIMSRKSRDLGFAPER